MAAAGSTAAQFPSCTAHTANPKWTLSLIFNDLTRPHFCTIASPRDDLHDNPCRLHKPNRMAWQKRTSIFSPSARHPRKTNSLRNKTNNTLMKFLNLATMDDLKEAEALSLKLEQEGIPSRVRDESNVQRFLFFTRPKGFSIVQVQEDDYARAARLVQLWDAENQSLAAHIFSCPECGSYAVEYPQYTRKYAITPMLMEWLSNLGLFEKQFYCRKCNATWAPGRRTRPNRPATPQSVLVPPHE